MNDTQQPAPADRLECPAAKDPAVRLFIGAGMAMAFGLWMVYDAYVLNKYPYPQPYELNAFATHVLNHYGPFVFIPLGAVLVVWGIVAWCRVLVADGEGIGYRGRASHPWREIASADASRLQTKGILVLHFTGGARLVLDSWKLVSYRELVAFVEAHLPPNAVTGV
ncbi:MAG: hypothetical protein MUP47_03105 [Phycisphaerae bacterium]|nr:hypothetical protein [Phycisphaerae bacterium]